MDALKQPTIRVVAIIAEGVPEADAKRLIAYARANNKVGTPLTMPLSPSHPLDVRVMSADLMCVWAHKGHG